MSVGTPNLSETGLVAEVPRNPASLRRCPSGLDLVNCGAPKSPLLGCLSLYYYPHLQKPWRNWEKLYKYAEQLMRPPSNKMVTVNGKCT